MTDLVKAGSSGRLPAEVTSFIGRRRELSQISGLLGAARLVTVSGAGGIGKTRLALRAAGRARRLFPDGTWFADLSEVRADSMLAPSLAQVFGLPEEPACAHVEPLADLLADRRLLLVLDTCEHLIESCVPVVETLLRSAPELRILVTSREPLGVPGEHVFVTPPMDVPPPDDPSGGAGCDAFVLFAERAAAAVPGFTVDAAEPGTVARLCHRLDGVPLAIELAAIRLRGLSVAELADRLDDRFGLLDPARPALDRHRSLRATVGWSHELCTPEERVAWARLSVFTDGFDLAAAEHVAGGDGLPPDTVLETLARLVEKSIISRDDHPCGSRYRMPGTVRAYGREWLARLGETDTAAERHCDWYARLAGPARPAHQSDLGPDAGNLRSALDHALAADDGRRALRLAATLGRVWLTTGRFQEARARLHKVLSRCHLATPERVEVVFTAGLFAALQGDRGDAEELRGEGCDLACRLGRVHDLSYAAQLEGLVALLNDDLDRALRLWESPPPADDLWTTLRLPLLAAVHCLRGDLDRAVACCERCLAAGDHTWAATYALWVRGVAACLRGHPREAAVDGRQALRGSWARRDALGLAMSLDLLGTCAMFAGDHPRAARLFSAAEARWRRVGGPVFGPAYASLRQAVIAQVRAGTADWDGARTPIAAVVADALGCGLPDTATACPLTRRELQIAELVAQGLSNRQIAERLTISKRTADSHIEHIFGKLGFTSRTQIASWAAGKGVQGDASR